MRQPRKESQQLKLAKRRNALVCVHVDLVRNLQELRFAPPVALTYQPLEYAWDCYAEYIQRFALRGARVLLLGMNPGPFGMAQTGIPFGEIESVRDWLKLRGRIAPPTTQHPKRPILGFDCPRREVSGKRLWGWAADDYGSADAFFSHFWVYNYCPLAFLEETGRNRTPDKLPRHERDPLFSACDQALSAIVRLLGVDWVLGIGKFAEQRAQTALADEDIRIECLPHPSPANPAANAGWDNLVRAKLNRLMTEYPQLTALLRS